MFPLSSWARRFPWPLVLLTLLALLLVRHLVSGESLGEAGLRAAEAAGDPPKTSHYIASGLRWASWINLAGLVALLLTARVWLRPLPAHFRPVSYPALPDRQTWITAGLAATALVFLVLPRMNHSLWSDEEYTMRRSVFEDYNRKSIEDSGLSRRAVKWRDTLWEVQETEQSRRLLDSGPALAQRRFSSRRTGPVPLSRAPPPSSRPDRRGGRPLRDRRPPALHRNAFAGRLAAVLLAIHPWYLRYASEARGYSLAMLLGVVTVWLLLLAVDRGKWRFWLAFGASQFYLLYTYPGSLSLVAMVNLLAVILLARRDGGASHGLWSRWLVVSMGGALLFLQLMLPCLLQLVEFLPQVAEIGAFDARWLRDTASLMLFGQTWEPWDPGNPYCRSLVQSFAGKEWLLAAVTGLTLAALGTGTLLLGRSPRQTRLLFLVFLLPAPLLVVMTWWRGGYLYPWYLNFALPFTLGLLAAGFTWKPEKLSSLLGLAFAILFFFLTGPQRSVLRRHPIEPMRESVQLTREVVNAADPAIHSVVTAGFVQYTRGYDPAFHQVKSAGELQKVMRWAEEQDRPLFLNYAMPDLARQLFPDVMKIVDDPALFEPVGPPLYGLEPQNTRFVRRYLGSAR